MVECRAIKPCHQLSNFCITIVVSLRTKLIGVEVSLLHIVPFCERPNKKLEGFAKQKQPAIFAMRHASHLVVHHPSLIYNVLYNHRNTFATYTTKKTLRPAQSPSTLAIFHTLQCLIILKTLHILQYKTYC